MPISGSGTSWSQRPRSARLLTSAFTESYLSFVQQPGIFDAVWRVELQRHCRLCDVCHADMPAVGTIPTRRKSRNRSCSGAWSWLKVSVSPLHLPESLIEEERPLKGRDFVRSHRAIQLTLRIRLS